MISRPRKWRRSLKRLAAKTSRLPCTRATPPAFKPLLMRARSLIEHGNEVTDEQLKQMRDKGIFLDLTPAFYGGFL